MSEEVQIFDTEEAAKDVADLIGGEVHELSTGQWAVIPKE